MNIVHETDNTFDIVISSERDSVRVMYCSYDIDILKPAPAPVLRTGRTADPGIAILRTSFHNIDVGLMIEKVYGDLYTMRIAVYNPKTKIVINALRVDLITGGRELVSDHIEDGEAVLEDINSGQYTIIIRRREKIFGEITLKIL